MSYILEALKKSQQERELGRVPTLDVMPVAAEGPDPRPSYWGMAAVSLAAVAVIIALYTALRGIQTAPEAESGPAGPAVQATVPATPAAPIPAAVAPEPPPPAPASSVPEQARPAAPQGAVAPAGEDMAKTKASARPEATRKREESRDGAQEPVAVPREPPRPVEPVPPKRDKVPEDLRQEIEAFKDSLRNKDNKPPRKAEAPAAEVPPQELRLPKDVAARLPTLIMTVHIHDENPAKRFVLINGRKIREGKSTRDGVTVEEILPDGAVLSYDGHKFFRHR